MKHKNAVHRKQLTSLWAVIAAIAFFSFVARVLLPVYRDVFHGIIVLLILLTLLTCDSTSPPETKNTSDQRVMTEAQRKAGVGIAVKSHQKRARKRPAIGRPRKRKKRTR